MGRTTIGTMDIEMQHSRYIQATVSAIVFAMLVGCVANNPSTTDQSSATHTAAVAALFPADKTIDVSPDTHLVLTFTAPPTIGASGLIRIYDADHDSLVDTLDISIPPSPRPTGRASPANPNDKTVYQINMIGGFDFHFFPIIVRGNVATIYAHNGALKYGRRYRVEVDGSVLTPAKGEFAGIKGTAWTFSTKAAPPSADATRLVVAADGSGDFNTVQGAIDFLPAKPAQHVTIDIKNGRYEEIVFMREKSNVTLRGESRDNVLVGYPNNSAFNPSRGGPSRRPAFSIFNSTDIRLTNFTIENYFIGQAEALLVRGEKVVIDHMTLNGSGDALTTYGTIYMADSKLTGHGDTILGYAALFCLRCEVHSIGPFTWTRTPKDRFGNVFVDSTFIAIDKPLPWTVTADNPGQKSKSVFARLPRNSPGSSAPNFPYAQMVLINTTTQGVSPEGWGPVEEPPGFDSSYVRFWEYNTMDMNGRPIDMSQRHSIVKVLSKHQDAQTIADYSNPEFVLGWKPVLQ